MKKLGFCCFILTFALLAGFAGCAKTDTSDASGSKTPSTSTPSASSSVMTLADELGYGYVSTYYDIPVKMDYINRMLYSSGRIIIYGESYNQQTYESTYTMFSMLPDCTDVQMMETPDIGSGWIHNMAVDSEGNIWIQTYEYIYEGDDDNEEPVPTARPIEDTEPFSSALPDEAADEESSDAVADTDTPTEDLEESEEDIEASSGEPVSAVLSEKLRLALAAGDVYYGDEYYNENYTTREIYTLTKLDPSGKKLIEFDLSTLSTGSYFYVTTIYVSSDGYIYVGYCVDDKYSIAVLDTNVNLLFSVATGDSYVDTILEYDGMTMAKYYDSNEGSYVYSPINILTRDFGEAIVPKGGNYNYYYSYTGADGKMYASDGLQLGQYDLMTNTVTPMLNWIDSDINGDNNNNVIVLSEKEVIIDYYDSFLESRQIVSLKQIPVSEIPESIVLSYACVWVDWQIKNAIISFNRNNGTYRITVKDYSQYNTDDDYNAGYTRLNNDLIAGNIPDIFSVNGLNLGSYTGKGLIADLYDLIDNDPEVGRDYFADGVLHALEQDGKLYQMGLSFSIETPMGLSSVVGDTPGWTVDEMMAAYKSMPEGARLMQWTTKESFLRNFVQYCIGDYVDYSTGTCSFDSDDFIKLMEIANTFPDNYDDYYSSDEDYVYQDESTLMKNGQLMLTWGYYSGFTGNDYNRAQFLDTPVTYIGYPRSGTGSGAVMYMNSLIALSAKSKNTDGAWAFLKFLIGEESQSTLSWNFPVSKARFDVLAQEAMEPPYYMENDEKVVYESTYWVDDVEVILPPMTQAEVDAIKALITGVENTSSYSYDQTMMDILLEEAGVYFSGAKSAKEVAGIIQNRVSMYIMENM